MVSARRFQALNVDIGNSALDAIDTVDVIARAPTAELPAPEGEVEEAAAAE